jgi:DNA recombination-dependent growth factor C
VITAKIRNQLKRDESNVTAELEEIEEDNAKNLSENNLRRLKRQTTDSTLPIHFEASKNDTDKSVHLTLTVQN